MTAIWQNDGDAWKLLSPEGFPAEAALHDLVAQSPELLPLSGSPNLAVLGREVQLGTGYADILAVEDNGRLVVIEVKLSRNSEARRAVVAQVLAYAAYLHGMAPATLDELVARSAAGASVSDIAASSLNDDLFDRAAWEEGLRASLADGWFRLVLVLDEAPDDLVRLVGYLERVTDEQLIIDLVTVASYGVNGTRVVVPQRIDSRSREQSPPERSVSQSARARRPTASSMDGSSPFEDFISEISPEHQEALRQVTNWAKSLEARGHARLKTSIGIERRVLRVLVPGEDAGLVAIWGEKRRPSVGFHLTVVGRRAPSSLQRLKELLPATASPTLPVEEMRDEILAVVENAYAEAAAGRVSVGPR